MMVPRRPEPQAVAFATDAIAYAHGTQWNFDSPSLADNRINSQQHFNTWPVVRSGPQGFSQHRQLSHHSNRAASGVPRTLIVCPLVFGSDFIFQVAYYDNTRLESYDKSKMCSISLHMKKGVCIEGAESGFLRQRHLFPGPCL